MSKHTLGKEIQRELEKLNDRIDHKIIKGLPFQNEARRHKDLLATLARINEDQPSMARVVRKSFGRVKSPVRRSLAGGAIQRLFGFKFA
ncbi:MAG: hypothetical protein KBD24_02690 [Candidatus Pacebacteria bacterium]|nr:hypothetical protein [Candidatus Paceibacterota bacterium]